MITNGEGKSSVACWSGSSIPKSKAVYNSNCQRYTGEHGESRWELCTTRTSQVAKTQFLNCIDNIDVQVDTSDDRNSLCNSYDCYQREPSVEDAIDVVAECVTTTQSKSARSLKDDPTTSTNKSILIHELESMVAESATFQTGTIQHSSTSIIIDGIALVQEMVVYKSQIKTCKDLLDCFV